MSYIDSAKPQSPLIWVDFIKSVQNNNMGQACADFSFIVKSEFGNDFENAAKHIIGAISDIDFDRNKTLDNSITKMICSPNPNVKKIGEIIDHSSKLSTITMTFAA